MQEEIKDATLSPKQAERLANKLYDVMSEVKELEAKKTEMEEELREYVTETGEQVVGPLKAYTRASPMKLAPLGGKTLAKLEDLLVDKLTEQEKGEYVTVKLNAKLIAETWEEDPELRRILSKYVRPEAGESKIYFKSAVA